MNTGGTAQLGDTNDRGLDILAGDHHQVRKLVDDNDQIGHLLGRVVVMLKLAGGLLFVVGRDLTHVETLEDLQATLHLGHGPLQSARGLLGLGHYRHVKMRQTVIARKLDALGVDHDQANVLGKRAHEQGRDDGVDHHRLTRTGRAGDQQVGHLGEVGDDRRTLGIATDGQLERTALHIGQHVAQVDVLALAIGDLDTHERRAGDRGKDTNRLSCERKRNIVLEARNLAHALALARLQLKGRHRGAGDPADHAGAAAKLKQGRLQRLGSLLQLLVRRRSGSRLRVGMQNLKWRKFEAVLFFALVICGAAVRSPIAGRSRFDSTQGRRIGNLGMLQEVGDLRCCRDRIHGKRRLGLVDLIGVVFHRKLTGYLVALCMATRQQSCLCGLNRSLVVLVITLGELNLALGPRRVGLTRIQLGRGLALLNMTAWQQRRLSALGLHGIGHVDKRILVLIVIVQNRAHIVAHDRGHGSIGALLTKNAQVWTGNAGNRQGLIVTPRARVDVGTTALGKICRTIAGRAQHATHRKADDDKTNDGQTQQDYHRDRLTQGILQRTRNKRTDVATRSGQILRREHKIARVARTRHHQRKNGDNGDKNHGSARDRANVERRVLA